MNKLSIIRFLSLFLFTGLVFFSCKNEDIDTNTFTIERERVVPTSDSVYITGSYSFTGTVNNMKINIGEMKDLIDATVYPMQEDGTDFSITVGGLKPLTQYYYRYSIYFEKSHELLTETKSFTTLDVVTKAPTVNTLELLTIDSTSFRVKCEVVSDGNSEVTERGICWNTYGDPTIDDAILPYSSGGVGQYTLRLENLSLSTNYYVCAYAQNAMGVSYGKIIEFRTGSQALLPQVYTIEISSVTFNAATCSGNVTSNGGLKLLERGVCWGLEANPSINAYHAMSEDTTSGFFITNINGLEPNTTYHARCYAINEKGIAYGEELTFTTTEGLPSIITAAITDITATSAKGGGEVTDEGASPVTERGLCWSTNNNPTISDNHCASGSGTGNYTTTLTNLSPNGHYFVRAYATNTQGTAYGTEVDFIVTPGLSMVHTLDVTDITATSAIVHCEVTEQGGSSVTERGICWDPQPSPTVNGNHIISGTGEGVYTVCLLNLTPGTTYYVRAYAQNTLGITYGEPKMFCTTANLPTVTTGEVWDITQSSAQCSGNVTDNGGAAVTEKGICWSIHFGPTINDNHISSGIGTGYYTATMAYLMPGITYHVRAYAINNAGIAYGNEVSFITLAPIGAINGLFTVDSRGSQVFFSQGNLQYQPSTFTWRFAENQWDLLTLDSMDVSSQYTSTYNGWIDLFGWGTSGYNHGAVCYQPWSTSIYFTEYYAYGSPSANLYDQTGQADWGYNTINNGGNQCNQWRTLTDSEWTFIVHDRTTSSGILCAPALVNGVNGLILLPDTWDANTYSLNHTNSTYSFDDPNIISASTWLNIFQNNGAVFLPAAGERNGTNVTSVGTKGNYWSSSTAQNSVGWYACFFSFHGMRGIPANILLRSCGFSVRLVQTHF